MQQKTNIASNNPPEWYDPRSKACNTVVAEELYSSNEGVCLQKACVIIVATSVYFSTAPRPAHTHTLSPHYQRTRPVHNWENSSKTEFIFAIHYADHVLRYDLPCLFLLVSFPHCKPRGFNERAIVYLTLASGIWLICTISANVTITDSLIRRRDTTLLQATVVVMAVTTAPLRQTAIQHWKLKHDSTVRPASSCEVCWKPKGSRAVELFYAAQGTTY